MIFFSFLFLSFPFLFSFPLFPFLIYYFSFFFLTSMDGCAAIIVNTPIMSFNLFYYLGWLSVLIILTQLCTTKINTLTQCTEYIHVFSYPCTPYSVQSTLQTQKHGSGYNKPRNHGTSARKHQTLFLCSPHGYTGYTRYRMRSSGARSSLLMVVLYICTLQIIFRIE